MSKLRLLKQRQLERLSKDEQNRVKSEVLSCPGALELIRIVIREKVEHLTNQLESDDNFDNPYKVSGYVKAIKELKSILKILEEETSDQR